jgi:hypothetical protein
VLGDQNTGRPKPIAAVRVYQKRKKVPVRTDRLAGRSSAQGGPSDPG